MNLNSLCFRWSLGRCTSPEYVRAPIGPSITINATAAKGCRTARSHRYKTDLNRKAIVGIFTLVLGTARLHWARVVAPTLLLPNAVLKTKAESAIQVARACHSEE